jgi:hypothetical protein
LEKRDLLTIGYSIGVSGADLTMIGDANANAVVLDFDGTTYTLTATSGGPFLATVDPSNVVSGGNTNTISFAAANISDLFINLGNGADSMTFNTDGPAGYPNPMEVDDTTGTDTLNINVAGGAIFNHQLYLRGWDTINVNEDLEVTRGANLLPSSTFFALDIGRSMSVVVDPSVTINLAENVDVRVHDGSLNFSSPSETILALQGTTGTNNVSVDGVVSGSDATMTIGAVTALPGANTNLRLESDASISLFGAVAVNGSWEAVVDADNDDAFTVAVNHPISAGQITITGTNNDTLQLNATANTTSANAAVNVQNMALDLGNTFDVPIGNVAPGTGFPQISASGTVDVSNTTLNVSLVGGFVPSANTTFRIIDKSSPGAVTGTFAGLPDNATFSVGSTTFRIDYDGGTGNDVVLTVQAACVAMSVGGMIDVQCPTGGSAIFSVVGGNVRINNQDPIGGPIAASAVTGLNVTAAGNVDNTIDLSAVTATFFTSLPATGGVVIDAGPGNDTVIGSALGDRIMDGAGDDNLTGGAGNDLYLLTPGSTDVVNDTGGDDTVDFSAAALGVTIDMDDAAPQVVNANGDMVHLNGQIENFIGSPQNDAVTVAPLPVARTISGGGNGAAPGDSLILNSTSAVIDIAASSVSIGGTVNYDTFEALSVNGTGANDSITVSSFTPGFAGSLAINGQGGLLDSIDVNAPLILTANLDLTAESIELNNGTIATGGNQTYSGTVTISAPLDSSTGSGGAIVFDSALAAAAHDVTLTADEIDFGGTITGIGTVSLQPFSPAAGTVIEIGNAADSGPGALDITDAEIARFDNGTFAEIRIGNNVGQHTINVASASFNNSVAILAPQGNGNIHVNQQFDTLASVGPANIVLDAPTLTLDANVAATAAIQVLADASTLNSNVSLSGANAFVGGTIASQASEFNDLLIDASGTTILMGTIGAGLNAGLGMLQTIAGGSTVLDIAAAGNDVVAETVDLQDNVMLNSGAGVSATTARFSGTVNSQGAENNDLAVTASGDTTFGGAIGVGGMLGMLQTMGGGSTVLDIAAAGNDVIAAMVDLQDNVMLNSGAGVSATTANFSGTVNSQGAENNDLAVTAGGDTTFGGAIGVGGMLGMLQTMGGGSTVLDIAAPGNDVVAATVDLQDNVMLNSGAGVSATTARFSGTVNSQGAENNDLAVTASGDTTFGGAIGVGGMLGMLQTMGGGSTVLDIAAAGNDVIAAMVDLQDNVMLNSGAGVSATTATFSGTVNSQGAENNDLAVTAGGDTTFGGAIGVGGMLGMLQTMGGGSTVLDIAAAGTDVIAATVDLQDNVMLNNGAGVSATTANFSGTVNSQGAENNNLAVTAGGDTTFGGAIGVGGMLGMLQTMGGGSTVLDIAAAGDDVIAETVDLQDNVMLNSCTGVSATTAKFSGTVNSQGAENNDLAVTAGGDTTFGGAIGVGGMLGMLQTMGGGSTVLDIAAAGNDVIAAMVDLQDNVMLNNGAGVSATTANFSGTVDSQTTENNDLQTTTSGATTFGAPVGGAQPLGRLMVNSGLEFTMSQNVTTTMLVEFMVPEGGAQDSIRITGVPTIRSTTGPIMMMAGDDISIVSGASILADDAVDLMGDFGNGDSGGTQLLIDGMVRGSSVNATGHVNDDTIRFAMAAGGIMTTVNADAGADAITLHGSELAATAVLNAGDGGDAIMLGSAANSLDSLDGLTMVHGDGNSTGADVLYLNDHGDNDVNNRYDVSSTDVSRTGGVMVMHDTLEMMDVRAGQKDDRMVVKLPTLSAGDPELPGAVALEGNIGTDVAEYRGSDDGDTLKYEDMSAASTLPHRLAGCECSVVASNAGNDIVHNMTATVPSTMDLGSGDDDARGAASADVIYGAVGREVAINAGAGNDFVFPDHDAMEGLSIVANEGAGFLLHGGPGFDQGVFLTNGVGDSIAGFESGVFDGANIDDVIMWLRAQFLPAQFQPGGTIDTLLQRGKMAKCSDWSDNYSGTNLGTLATHSLASINASTQDVWYELHAAQNGILTANATYNAGDGAVQLTVFDSMFNIVADHYANSGNTTLSTPVTTAHEFYVRVRAVNPNVDLNLSIGQPAAGDFNQDGRVSLADMSMLQKAMGTTSSVFDLNFDGIVSAHDLARWVSHSFGSGGSLAAPSPAAPGGVVAHRDPLRAIQTRGVDRAFETTDSSRIQSGEAGPVSKKLAATRNATATDRVFSGEGDSAPTQGRSRLRGVARASRSARLPIGQQHG